MTLDSDYSLMPCSIGVDAGSNSFVADSTDINGNPRIMNSTVDIGAYEAMLPCGSPLPPRINSKTSDISIFPNPTQGKIFISTALERLDFQLYDVLGKMVANTDSKELDISHLPTGVYTLKVIQDEILVDSLKLVKKQPHFNMLSGNCVGLPKSCTESDLLYPKEKTILKCYFPGSHYLYPSKTSSLK